MNSPRRSQPTSTSAPPATHLQRGRHLAALGATLIALGLVTRPAHAEEGARAQAERISRELSTRTADRALLAPQLERVRSALQRAANARRAGDHRHGSELEALALELAQGAVDLTRAKEAQARLDETEQKAQAAETRVIRARALVEQTAARRGRAAERLRELEAEKQNPSAAAPAGKALPAVKAPVPGAQPAPAPQPGSTKATGAAPAGAKPAKAGAGSP